MPNDGDDLLLRGSLPKAIRVLAVPMALEMVMESVFAVADVYFVGRISTQAVAAVGLTETLLMLIYAVAFGIATATAAIVARRIGQDEPRAAADAAVQGIVLGLAMAVPIAVLGVVFAEDLLLAMGANGELAEYGACYLQIAFGANATIMLLFINNGALRGAGDAKAAMWALWLANGLNLVLDPCLIFGLGPFPELGLPGAAIATAIGRGAGVVFQLILFARGRGRLRVRAESVRVQPEVAAALGKLSIGAMLQELVETASWVVLVRILATFGEHTVAAYTIALRVLIFALLPAWGIGNAAATLVGQNLGAGQPDRAERSVWLTGAYSVAFLFVVTLIMVPAARPLVALFSDVPEVIAVGEDCLRTISYGYVFYAWGMVVVLSFNGAGDTVTPTVLNVVTLWFFKLPCAYFLANYTDLGASGVFIAVTLSYSALAVLGFLLFRRGRWKRRVV